MNRIVIIAPVHVWNDVRVFEKQARSLAACGYDVYLLARVNKKINSNGVTVVPVLYQGESRVLRFLSLPFVAFQALTFKADIYHLHNPDTLIVASILKLLRNKVIYDTHEDFTKRILSRKWIPVAIRKPLATAVGKMEKYFAKYADLVLCTQPSVAKRMREGKCIILGNPPRNNEKLIQDVRSIASTLELPECDLRLVYIGTINSSRGLVEMVDAMPLINESFNCRISMVGAIEQDELRNVSKRPGWDYVDFISRVPQEIAFAYIYLADVGLIYLRDEGGHDITDPNKIYEYMAFSKPFIASAFDTWMRKFGGLGAGVFTPAGSSERLAEAVVKLGSSPQSKRIGMGEKGKRFVVENCWEKEFEKLRFEYENLLNS